MISLALDMCRPMQGGIFVLWFRGVGSELCTGGVVPPPPSPGVVMHGQKGGGVGLKLAWTIQMQLGFSSWSLQCILFILYCVVIDSR